jgi:hypothetical protein
METLFSKWSCQVRNVINKLLQIPLHPVFIGLFPILSLLNENAEGVHPENALRSLILMGGFTGTIVVANMKFSKQPHQTAIVISTSLLLALSFGHLENLLKIFPGLGKHTPILLLLIIFLTVTLSKIISKSIRTSEITKQLNLISLFLASIPFVILLRHEISFLDIPDGYHRRLELEHICTEETSEKHFPDIYYIVLDGYARADVLEEIYSFDNSTFLHNLENFGFEIHEMSRSNYAQTNLSLAAALNANYIQQIFPTLEKSSHHDRYINGLIQKSDVIAVLKECGYSTLAYETGYRRTELRQVDYFAYGASLELNSFESFLINNSIFRLAYMLSEVSDLGLTSPGYEGHRIRIEFTFNALAKVHQLFPQPIFVFAHIISPHPPFVFSSEGESINPSFPYVIQDADEFPGSKVQYQKGFVAQTAYVNERVIRLVRHLLDSYDGEVIIILQSDHGPGSELFWDEPRRSNLKERMSILNSIYFPGTFETELPESFSQVNTFRFIFNELFDTDLAILPDQSFFSSWRKPTDFVEYHETHP